MGDNHTDFQWNDLSSQTLRNPDGDVLAGCEQGALQVSKCF